MPYYQYRCNECEHEFEQRQRMSDEPLTVCPVCNGRIRRVVNSVGVVFKGSGFYVNDARSSNGSKNDTVKTSESKTTEKSPSETTSSEKTSATSASKEPATTSESK
jgi:putative FmdB family regulatory protein